MSVSSCEGLRGAPAGSSSIQSTVVHTPEPQPASCGDVWVHVVDETNGEVLLRYHAVAEALKQESTFFSACLSKNWVHTTSSNGNGSQAQQPVVLLYVAGPQHTYSALVMLDIIHDRTPGLPAWLRTTGTAAYRAVEEERSASAAACLQREACIVAALADCYHVPRAIATGLSCLVAFFLHSQPCWDAVLFLLHSRQEGIGQHRDFARPYSQAVQYTLQQLRDLEAVLQHRELSQVLLALPGHVLLMLLQGPDTRVTWESTVVQAISAWLGLRAPGNVPEPLLRELAGCVRLRGLPRSYLNTVLAQLDWYNLATEPGTIQQAGAFLHIADSIHHELGTAEGGQQHTTAPGTTPNASSSSSSLSPAAIQESKALAAVLQSKLRSDPQWTRRLLPPRLPSNVQGITLTIDLSVSRLTLAYNSIDRSRISDSSSSSSSDGAGGSAQGSGWHTQWQPGHGSVGVFGGCEWWLVFRFVAASTGHHVRASSTGGTASGQQQQQAVRVSGRKRKQQEAFLQAEAAAAAAAAAVAAAAAGANSGNGLQGRLGGEGDAAVQQVLLESVLQQPGTDNLLHPAAADSAAKLQNPVTPPASRSGSGSSVGGSSGGSGTGPDSSSNSRRRITWSLQFGVSFHIPYLPRERQFVTPFLTLPTPTLQHPQAHNPSGSTVTRGQRAQEGTGVDPGSLPRLLQASQVLPCVELLPLRLRSSSWDEACDQKLQPYLDSDSRLRASVTISHMQ